MALNDLPADKREYYMAKADGIELKPATTSRQQVSETIDRNKEMTEIER